MHTFAPIGLKFVLVAQLMYIYIFAFQTLFFLKTLFDFQTIKHRQTYIYDSMILFHSIRWYCPLYDPFLKIAILGDKKLLWLSLVFSIDPHMMPWGFTLIQFYDILGKLNICHFHRPLTRISTDQ